ncbi:Hypothetical_protein [Hexamita inflata]|uniref:Hypothetical_protein n=1 Tax=Hexamita inflata TaxID=28002 RepID=A0AA86USV8_9EUKA|nr:Hypothetical protein HINF_LOCUS36273 [Hexamita inflata]
MELKYKQLSINKQQEQARVKSASPIRQNQQQHPNLPKYQVQVQVQATQNANSCSPTRFSFDKQNRPSTSSSPRRKMMNYTAPLSKRTSFQLMDKFGKCNQEQELIQITALKDQFLGQVIIEQNKIKDEFQTKQNIVKLQDELDREFQRFNRDFKRSLLYK